MSHSNETATTTIDAPPKTVFAILTDPAQHSRIDGSGTVKGTVSGETDLKLGSRFKMDMKMGVPYKISNKVVEFEQDRLIAWKHMGLHRWRYELTPTAEGGTEVTETWDVSHYPGPVGTLLAKRVGSGIRKSINRTLVRLKQAAEEDARG